MQQLVVAGSLPIKRLEAVLLAQTQTCMRLSIAHPYGDFTSLQIFCYCALAVGYPRKNLMHAFWVVKSSMPLDLRWCSASEYNSVLAAPQESTLIH